MGLDLGQIFACIAVHKSAEPNTLVVRIPFDQRDELVSAAADTYVSIGRLKLREFGDGTGELIYYERPDAVGPKVSNYRASSFESV